MSGCLSTKLASVSLSSIALSRFNVNSFSAAHLQAALLLGQEEALVLVGVPRTPHQAARWLGQRQVDALAGNSPAKRHVHVLWVGRQACNLRVAGLPMLLASGCSGLWSM